jgi:hypothetical protein
MSQLCLVCMPCKRKRKNGEEGGASVQMRTNSQGSQPRKGSVSAKIFGTVLRHVYNMGFLELLAGPWCYGQHVRISAASINEDADGESELCEGTSLWPNDGILADWALLNHDMGWIPGHGYNPGNALAVRWSDGDLRYYRADFEFDEHDLRIIVPLDGLQADAPVTHPPQIAFEHLYAFLPHLYPASARAEVAKMAANAQTQTEVVEKYGLAAKGAVYVERVNRYMYLCWQLHKREIYRTWPREQRLRKKRRFLAFCDHLRQAFYYSRDASWEWWEVKLLFG